MLLDVGGCALRGVHKRCQHLLDFLRQPPPPRKKKKKLGSTCFFLSFHFTFRLLLIRDRTNVIWSQVKWGGGVVQAERGGFGRHSTGPNPIEGAHNFLQTKQHNKIYSSNDKHCRCSWRKQRQCNSNGPLSAARPGEKKKKSELALIL